MLRRFQFFSKRVIGAPAGSSGSGSGIAVGDDIEPTGGKSFGAMGEEGGLVSCSGGAGYVVCGQKSGSVQVFNKEFEYAQVQAFDSPVAAAVHIKDGNLLVALGVDTGVATGGPRVHDSRTPAASAATFKSSGNTPAASAVPTGALLKIWTMNTEDSTELEQFSHRKTVALPCSKDASIRPTCMAVLPDFSYTAIGLSNGSIVLMEGHPLSDRHFKQSIHVASESSAPITSIFFRQAKTDTSVFVTTADEVFSFFLKRGGSKAGAPQKLVVDAGIGCGKYCATLSDEQKLVVGRSEAVYFYEADERGVCFGFDGVKKYLSWFNTYLIVVTESNESRDMLMIYDLRNKFIAFSGKFEKIHHVVAEYGGLVVLTAGRVYQLTEKYLSDKMDILLRKNLYAIAISMATSLNCDKAHIKDIYQRYGDHLYGKGDYDGAITQYVETINYVEPSYVIRKFLDAQLIHNLTTYLQTLHEKRRANTDHTTLLLNCYTKLKDVTNLDRFIRSEGLSFDEETAIKVCRQACYYEHAVFLAQKYAHHQLYLQIQMDDLHNYKRVLAHISSLPLALATKFAQMHGNTLMRHLPEETTALLIALCTDYTPTKAASSTAALVATTPVNLSPVVPIGELTVVEKGAQRCDCAADFIHFFVRQNDSLLKFLEAVVAANPDAPPVLYKTLLELLLEQATESASPTSSSSSSSSGDGELQQLEQEGAGPSEGRAMAAAVREAAGSKIMSLLKSGHPHCDDSLAMVLMQQHGFEKGIVHIHTKNKAFDQILQYHIENDQPAKIIRVCARYGEQMHNLWVIALSYFAMKGPDEQLEKETLQVLEAIQRLNLLSPLTVIHILSQNPQQVVGVVKGYIMNIFNQENNVMVADQAEIDKYRHDTAQMKANMDLLNLKPTTFQGTKCHSCTNNLSLPAVHFLCMHSFHQRCIIGNDKECPKCLPEYKRVNEIKNQMRTRASQHDQFYKELEASSDGYTTISEYFGRGIFGNT